MWDYFGHMSGLKIWGSSNNKIKEFVKRNTNDFYKILLDFNKF